MPESNETNSADDLNSLRQLMGIAIEQQDVEGEEQNMKDGVRDEFELDAPEIPGYVIQNLIATGGMGEVWRATQTVTGQIVALKIIGNRALTSASARQRFERELDIVARLDHPCIARVIDSGIHQRLYFIALQHVDGQTFDQYTEGITPIDELARFFRRIVDAVHFAHQRGVIHRDLKPSNVLVSSVGDPVIVDFGIAKWITEESNNITLPGEALGTLNYMSPEQAKGAVHDVDIRSDVYSLGVVLFESLTGDLPHEQTGTSFDVRERIVKGNLRSARKINPKVPNDLDAIIRKATAKEIGDRYGSAQALGDDLGRYLDRQPVTAKRATRRYLAAKFAARHWARLTLAAIVLAMFLSLAAFSFTRIKKERDAVVQELNRSKRVLLARNLSLGELEMNRGNITRALEFLEECPPQLRHWEWRWLWYQCDRSRTSTDIEDVNLIRASFEPSTGQLWTASRNGDVYVFDKSISGVQRRIQAPRADLRPLFVEAEHNMACYSTASGEILLWKIGDEHPLVLGRHARRANTGCIDRSGSLVATADTDGHVKVWSTSGQLIHQFNAPEHVVAIAFNPDGSLLGAGGNGLAIWNLSTGSKILNLDDDDPSISSIAFHPTLQQIVSGHSDGQLFVRDIDSGRKIIDYDGHQKRVRSIRFFDGGDRILTTGYDGLLCTWNMANRAPLSQLRGHRSNGVWWASPHPTDPVYVSIGHQAIKTWDVKQVGGRKEFAKLANSAIVGIEPFGSGVIATFISGDVKFHDGEKLVDLNRFSGGAMAQTSPSSNRAIVASKEGDTLRYELKSNKPVLVARNSGKKGIQQIGISGDGSTYVVSYQDGSSVVREFNDDRVVRTLPGMSAVVNSKGSLVATARETGAVQIWDISKRQARISIPSVSGTQVAFLDGPRRVILAGGNDLSVINLDDGSLHGRVEGIGPIMHMRPTLDGERIITVGTSITCIDAVTVQEVYVMRTRDGDSIMSSCFSKEGRTLYANSLSKIYAWRIP